VSDPGGATLAPHAVTPQEAADRAAIAHLGAAYGHAVDRRDYALLRALYHDDATDDHTPFYCGSAAGYVEWLPGMLAAWRMTSHRIISTLLLVDGDRAEGELAATAYHETLDGTRAFVAHGRYADLYARRDGIWRFAHRSFILDWTETRAIEPGDDHGTAGVGTGSAGADDPVYARLPLFGAQRAARQGDEVASR
jgi:hypothetical protein